MIADLAAEMARLGGTPEQVAATLADLHVSGQPRNACACPVANFVKGLGFKAALVGLRSVSGSTDGESFDVEAPAGVAVIEFARRFDEGEWPELVSATW